MDTDYKNLYKKSFQLADSKIKSIKDDRWEKQSTCSDWNVRELVNHLVNENLWQKDLLDGKTIAEVGDQDDGDLLGADPIRTWEETSAVAAESLEKIEDFNQIVHLSYADVPLSEYLSQRILDLTIHGWDVAKSTNQPDDLPEELVDFVYQMVLDHQNEINGSGVFGKVVEVPEEANKQTKLLALLGREA